MYQSILQENLLFFALYLHNLYHYIHFQPHKLSGRHKFRHSLLNKIHSNHMSCGYINTNPSKIIDTKTLPTTCIGGHKTKVFTCDTVLPSTFLPPTCSRWSHTNYFTWNYLCFIYFIFF